MKWGDRSEEGIGNKKRNVLEVKIKLVGTQEHTLMTVNALKEIEGEN